MLAVRITAFQAEYEGSIPFTRSNARSAALADRRLLIRRHEFVPRREQVRLMCGAADFRSLRRGLRNGLGRTLAAHVAPRVGSGLVRNAAERFLVGLFGVPVGLDLQP